MLALKLFFLQISLMSALIEDSWILISSAFSLLQHVYWLKYMKEMQFYMDIGKGKNI